MYDEENQLPQALFIIDEASMIDIYLAENLFKSIPNNAQVVIVEIKINCRAWTRSSIS